MIKDLIRSEFKEFIPYNANQVPYRVKLDANESPFELPIKVRKQLADIIMEGPSLYLYPDTDSIELRKTLSAYWGVDMEGIVVGTGSDQLIQVLVNTFVGKGEKVICPTPSFSMYKLDTIIGGGTAVEVPLKEENNFAYEIDEFIDKAKSEAAKLVVLCTPNNPTGNLLALKDIEKICSMCPKTVIVIDEAYAEFAGESAVTLLPKFENLIVLRTFSKAYGLAGIRCGYSLSGKEMANEINKVRPPYNISSLSQLVAKLVFEDREEIEAQIKYLIEQREYLCAELEKINNVSVLPSGANYILVKLPDAKTVAKELEKRGVLVRSFGDAPVLGKYIRISVGNKEQNDVLLEELKSIMN
ncbi:histidinol-phosphate transaminase [Acetivibrio cellulolyticus]|uniref:histidinol-phosphate transaminase n=1 Tax=Acetivibrio cellulolyticus TaxID=35830 RepID=UPI0001E2EBCB|nr:histidinol-phosphate transaminase [Acetivibrio cellulolyticus]